MRFQVGSGKGVGEKLCFTQLMETLPWFPRSPWTPNNQQAERERTWREAHRKFLLSFLTLTAWEEKRWKRQPGMCRAGPQVRRDWKLWESREGVRSFQEANWIHLPEVLPRFLVVLRIENELLLQPSRPLVQVLPTFPASTPPFLVVLTLWASFYAQTGRKPSLSSKPGHFGERTRMLLMNNAGQLGLCGANVNMWPPCTIGPATGPLHMLFSLFPTPLACLSRSFRINSLRKPFLIHQPKSDPLVMHSPRTCFSHQWH